MGKKKTRFQWEREPSESEIEERPSRRSLKREDNLHREMAKVLIGLSPEQWDRLPLSEDVRGALEEAHRVKSMTGVREGLRRQTQRVMTMLRQDDHEAITEALKSL